MSSFNYIGNRWAGGSPELCQTVLRDEWGFVGMVLTDYFGVYGYMNADQAVRNGTDFMLVNYPTETSMVGSLTGGEISNAGPAGHAHRHPQHPVHRRQFPRLCRGKT